MLKVACRVLYVRFGLKMVWYFWVRSAIGVVKRIAVFFCKVL